MFLIIVVYIFIGVFASLWMDKYYFDAKSPNGKASDNASVWRAIFWPFVLPVMWTKVWSAMKLKQEESKQQSIRQEAELKHRINTKSIVVPDSVTEIGHRAFERCNGLLEVPVKSKELLENACLPEHVKIIERG